MTFCSFVGMGRQSPFKVIASMMFGFAFACVGTDEVTGGLRLTFGPETLLTGFHFAKRNLIRACIGATGESPD